MQKMSLPYQMQTDNAFKPEIEIKQEPNFDDDLFCHHEAKTDLGLDSHCSRDTVFQPVKFELDTSDAIKHEGNCLLGYSDIIHEDSESRIENGVNIKSSKLIDSEKETGVKNKTPDSDSECEQSDSSVKENPGENKIKKKKSQPATCYICKKTFHKKSYLTKHLWLHTGELPYKCEYCEKAFNVRSNLTVHMRIHTGQKPHDCPLCDKSFRQKSQLDIHMRTHTGERPYPCDVCSRSFRNSSALIIHQRIHTGERPFTCEICSRSFSTSTSLKTHRVTHSGKMLYDCPVCGREFNRRNNLNVHIKRHDKNRRFHCPLCSNGFVMRAHVINHLKRSHNVDPEVAEIKYRELTEVFGDGPSGNSDMPPSGLSKESEGVNCKAEEKFEIEIVNDCS